VSQRRNYTTGMKREVGEHYPQSSHRFGAVTVACPALLITAPASGHGKTSVTAALARYHRRNGLRVRCFKTGPDFIDPTVLVQASGQPVYNLDTWIMGAEHCRQLLFEAAGSSDLILVEGVMGLFDGAPSSADLAELFGLPIVPVIDAAAMAQTFAAVLHGLASYRPTLQIAAAVANRIGSPRHAQLLREVVPSHIPFTALARDSALILPERHLGLQLAREIGDLDARLDLLADAIADTPLAQLPAPVTFAAPVSQPLLEPVLEGVTVAVAFDQAFCFLYQANLEWLQRMGARVQFFSPLEDAELPDADALYLPGGYPELHAAALADNITLQDDIRDFVEAGGPLLAECGGMLYLADTLVDFDGDKHALLGLLPATVTMGERLAAIGSQGATIDGAHIRGHTFHYSSLHTDLPATWQAQTADGRSGEAVYRSGSVIASYLHWYFPSNPQLVASWLKPA
jgi:cobyrinic acid a,c-diamide synthase